MEKVAAGGSQGRKASPPALTRAPARPLWRQLQDSHAMLIRILTSQIQKSDFIFIEEYTPLFTNQGKSSFRVSEGTSKSAWRNGIKRFWCKIFFKKMEIPAVFFFFVTCNSHEMFEDPL